MTRAKISEYSATANDNTDVNGINIAENCPPSSMNNMGREIMAALKRFQVGSDGDGVTVGGSLVVSGSTTVNTFNVDVISEKTSAAGVTIDGVLLKDSLVGIGADGSASAPSIYRSSDTNTGIFFPAADTIAFAEGGAEAMRIDSSGNVGIGATPPTVFSGHSYLQMGAQAVLAANKALSATGQTYLTHNLYYDASGTLQVFNTTNANEGCLYQQVDGIHVWSSSAATTGTPTVTERARITSVGFFKASSTGSLISPTGTNHEFRSGTGGNIVIRTQHTAADPYGSYTDFSNATPNNTTNYFEKYDDSTNEKAVLYSNGSWQVRANSYGGISDVKLKQDIVDANSQWNDIKGLRIRKYRFKDEVAADPNYPSHLGVIAQEAELVSPGLVFESPDFENVSRTREVEKTREVEVTPAVLDEDSNVVEPAVMETETYTEEEEYTERVATGTVTKGVKYSILYMKAVKALQEAMERIETLEAKVSALEAK